MSIEEDKVRFDCRGHNAPAYGCNKPGDMSGEYYPAHAVDSLRGQLAASQLEVQRLRDALELYRGQIANDGASGYAENYLSTHSDLSALREHEARVIGNAIDAFEVLGNEFDRMHRDDISSRYVAERIYGVAEKLEAP